MSIDTATLEKLRYQSRRMRHALMENNQREADVVHRRVDQILDERPKIWSVATDGEVVYDNASPWEKAQVGMVFNAGPADEKVMVEAQIAAMVAETERFLGLGEEAEKRAAVRAAIEARPEYQAALARGDNPEELEIIFQTLVVRLFGPPGRPISGGAFLTEPDDEDPGTAGGGGVGVIDRP